MSFQTFAARTIMLLKNDPINSVFVQFRSWFESSRRLNLYVLSTIQERRKSGRELFNFLNNSCFFSPRSTSLSVFVPVRARCATGVASRNVDLSSSTTTIRFAHILCISSCNSITNELCQVSEKSQLKTSSMLTPPLLQLGSFIDQYNQAMELFS